MSQVLLISDSIENTRFDVARKTSTFKSYDLEPVLAIPQIDAGDGTSTKTDIAEILDYCFEECKPACIALSIIRDPAAVKLVADKLASCEHNAVLSEISLISREGEVLVTSDTYEMIMKYLLPQIQFISVNIYEAELLAQMNCSGKVDIETAAKIIFDKYHSIVYINGSAKSRWHDLLCIGGQTKWLRARADDSYIPADKSLLAAIACEMAGDKSIIEAVVSARKFFVPTPLITEPSKSSPAAQTATAPAPAQAVKADTKAEVKADAPVPAKVEPAKAEPAVKETAADKPSVASNTGRAAASYKPVYSTGGYSFTAMAAQKRREQAEKQKAEAEKKAADEAKQKEPEPEPAAKEEPTAETGSEHAPVKSLVSPAKSIRDIARSFELNDVNEGIAKKMSADAEPAVTSNIEEPEPGPKGTVSEIKEREKRSAEQSLSELKALKERFKNMSSSSEM